MANGVLCCEVYNQLNLAQQLCFENVASVHNRHHYHLGFDGLHIPRSQFDRDGNRILRCIQSVLMTPHMPIPSDI